MSSRDEQPTDGDVSADLSELADLGERIALAVDAYGAAYVQRRAGRILDAWGRIAGDGRARLDDDVVVAARAGAARVAASVRALFAEAPQRQRATPLEVVRTIGRETTTLLEGAGVASVVRDDFEERSFPDDVYDLAPRTLGDLAADPTAAPGSAVDTDPAGLGALQLAWGLAKTRALRAGLPPGRPPDVATDGP